MRAALFALLLLLPLPARAADIIDYVLKFSTEAQAVAAAEIGGFRTPDGTTWSGATVIAPVSVYRTTAIGPGPDFAETRVVQGGYWMAVSTIGRNATIEGCACLQIEADRTLAESGAPAGQWLLANNTGISGAALGQRSLPTWHIEPLFAGAQAVYHIGGQ